MEAGEPSPVHFACEVNAESETQAANHQRTGECRSLVWPIDFASLLFSFVSYRLHFDATDCWCNGPFKNCDDDRRTA